MKPCIQVGIEARNAYTKFQNSNLTTSTWKTYIGDIDFMVRTHAITDRQTDRHTDYGSRFRRDP